jgi:CubicO group peptidase (beta-lactamase class C family)
MAAMGAGRKAVWMRRLFTITAALAGTVAIAQAPGPQTPPLTPAPVIATTPMPATATARDLTGADATAWLDGYMPYALHAGDIAGAVVMVVKDGQIVASRGYGYADVAKRIPVDPARTLFRPGSTSKLVTWTAVMQLVEAGKLDLDKDVNAYIDFHIPPRGGRPVTLRQIMTHTAGFEEVQKDIIFDDPKHDMPLAVYLKRWVPARIFDAGTTPAYSNYATAIAGYIVTRVSGEPFDEYVERHIFAPLDMRTASFRQPLPPTLRPLSAKGYGRASEPSHPFEFVGPAPAGSLSASGLDMAKFMIAHLDDGRGILKPETARMMHDSPLGPVDPTSLIPPLNRMELGFFETNINNREVIAHLGDTNWFHTSLHLFLAERTGLYVSFNSVGRDGAVGALRQQLFQDFADRYFPAIKPDGHVDAATAASHGRAMSGHWESSRRSQTNFFDILNLFGQTDVSFDARTGLVVPALKTPGGAVRTWNEIAPFVWRENGGHERLSAQLVDGQPVRWSFDLVAPFMVYDRVPLARSPRGSCPRSTPA